MAKKEAVYKYNYDKMLRPISEQVGGSKPKAKPRPKAKAKPKPRLNQDRNMYAEPDREGPGKSFPAAKPKAKAKPKRKPSVINGLDVSRKGSQPVKKKPGKKKTGGVNMKLKGAGALGYGPYGGSR